MTTIRPRREAGGELIVEGAAAAAAAVVTPAFIDSHVYKEDDTMVLIELIREFGIKAVADFMTLRAWDNN